LPLSAFAENRGTGRTDLERLAADLARVFGSDNVVLERREPPRREQPRPDTAPTVRNSSAMSAEAIVAATNRERAAHGLRPLRLNQRLSLAAGNRVEDMLAKHYFAHVSPDGVEPFIWATRNGYKYRLIGENLALGYRGADRVVTGWMNSPGHRENILTAQFDEVGIAISSSSPSRGYRGPLVVAMYAKAR
jgi:uncharacterized protein YkwD